MPDGQRILSGSMDNTVRVWLLDGALKNTFELHTDTVMPSWRCPTAARAPPRRQDGQALQRQRQRVLRTFRHHTDPVMCLALLSDGRRFVSASEDKTACVFEHGLAPSFE